MESPLPMTSGTGAESTTRAAKKESNSVQSILGFTRETCVKDGKSNQEAKRLMAPRVLSSPGCSVRSRSRLLSGGVFAGSVQEIQRLQAAANAIAKEAGTLPPKATA